jgi:tRNA-Thr(GGU) m(6)t(6)A37 methyltransferase TsaA
MLTITPIGTVRNEVKTPIVKGWGRVLSDLVLEERYAEALDGIEDYSHVVVIFWMDQAGPPESLKGHVQNRKDLPIAGLFARRGPSRPNPIGVTAVPLLSRAKNVLRVQGLDAIDGTPLVDIKPYTTRESQNGANAFTRLRTTCSGGAKGGNCAFRFSLTFASDRLLKSASARQSERYQDL